MAWQYGLFQDDKEELAPGIYAPEPPDPAEGWTPGLFQDVVPFRPHPVTAGFHGVQPEEDRFKPQEAVQSLEADIADFQVPRGMEKGQVPELITQPQAFAQRQADIAAQAPAYPSFMPTTTAPKFDVPYFGNAKRQAAAALKLDPATYIENADEMNKLFMKQEKEFKEKVKKTIRENINRVAVIAEKAETTDDRGLIRSIFDSAQRGNTSFILELLSSKAAEKELPEGPVFNLINTYDQIITEDPIEGKNFFDSAIIDAAASSPGMAHGIKERVKAYAGVAGTTGVAGFLVGGPGGALTAMKGAHPLSKAASVVASQRIWAKQGKGQIYKDLRDNGIDPDLARMVSTVGGHIYAGIENAQLEIWGKAATGKFGLKGIGSGKFGKLFSQGAIAWLANRGITTAAEIHEEGLQQLTQDLALNTALALDPGADKEKMRGVKTLSDRYFQAMKDSAGAVGVITFLTGVPADIQRKVTGGKLLDVAPEVKKTLPKDSFVVDNNVYKSETGPFGEVAPQQIGTIDQFDITGEERGVERDKEGERVRGEEPPAREEPGRPVQEERRGEAEITPAPKAEPAVAEPSAELPFDGKAAGATERAIDYGAKMDEAEYARIKAEREKVLKETGAIEEKAMAGDKTLFQAMGDSATKGQLLREAAEAYEAKGEKPVGKKTEAIGYVDEQVQQGTISEGSGNLLKYLVSTDDEFDKNTTVQISDTVKEITDDMFRAEGIDPVTLSLEERKLYSVKGRTVSYHQEGEGVYQTAIELYKGHDADTIVEEWYHRGYNRLTEDDKKVYQEYHKKTGDKRIVEEHFAQEGRDLFFSDKAHEQAGTIRKIFDNARDTLKKLIARIRDLRKAKVPKKIQGLYRKAAGIEPQKVLAEKVEKPQKVPAKKVAPKPKPTKKFLELKKRLEKPTLTKPVKKGLKAKLAAEETLMGLSTYKRSLVESEVKRLKAQHRAETTGYKPSKYIPMIDPDTGDVVGKISQPSITPLKEYGIKPGAPLFAFVDGVIRVMSEGSQTMPPDVRWFKDEVVDKQKAATDPLLKKAYGLQVEAIDNYDYEGYQLVKGKIDEYQKLSEADKREAFQITTEGDQPTLFTTPTTKAEADKEEKRLADKKKAEAKAKKETEKKPPEQKPMDQLSFIDMRDVTEGQVSLFENFQIQKEGELITSERFDGDDLYSMLGTMYGNELRLAVLERSPDKFKKSVEARLNRLEGDLSNLADKIIEEIEPRIKGWLDEHGAYTPETWVDWILDEEGMVGEPMLRPDGTAKLAAVGGSQTIDIGDAFIDRYNKELATEPPSVEEARDELIGRGVDEEELSEMEDYEVIETWEEYERNENPDYRYFADSFVYFVELYGGEIEALKNDSEVWELLRDVLATDGYKQWYSGGGISADTIQGIKDVHEEMVDAKTAREKITAIDKAINIQHHTGNLADFLDISQDQLDELAEIGEVATSKGEKIKSMDFDVEEFHYQLRYEGPFVRPDFEKQKLIEAEVRKLRAKRARLFRKPQVTKGQEITVDVAETQLPEELLYERAQITVEINALTDEVSDKVKRLLIQYAQRVGLRGEPFNRVDTKVKNVRTTKQLTRAIAEIDELVQKRMQRNLVAKVIRTVRKERKRLREIKKGKKKQSKLSLWSNNRLEEYLDILEIDIKERNIEKLRKSQAFFEENPDAPIPQELMNDIIALNRDNVRLMSANQLQGILSDIESIKKQGYTSFKLKEAQRKRALDAAVKKTVPHIKPPSDKSPFEIAAKGKGKKSIYKTLQKAWWNARRAERILNWLVGYKDTPMKKMVMDKILKAEAAELVEMDARTQEFKERYSGLDILSAKLDAKTYSVPVEISRPGEAPVIEKRDVELSLNNLMFFYAHSRNQKGRNHLMGWGISEETIDYLADQLPEKHRAAIDDQQRYYDRVQWGRVNEPFEQEHGISMPRESYYMPMPNVKSDNAINEIVSDLVKMMSSRPSAVAKGMTISRTDSGTPFADMDYFGTVLRNMRMVEHYIAFNQVLREVNQFLNSKEMSAAIEAKSPLAKEKISRWLGTVAAGRLEAAADEIDEASDVVRLNAVYSVLTYNIVTMMTQIPSYIQGSAHVKAGHMARSLIAYMGHAKEINAFVNENSTMMKYRGESFLREQVEFMAKDRTFDLVKTELEHDSKKRGGRGWERTVRLFDQCRNFGMAGIRITDKTVTNILWAGKYFEVMDNIGDTYNESSAKYQERHKQAKYEADELIRTTQPMGGLVHLPESFRVKGIKKLFATFKNQPNQNINGIADFLGAWKEGEVKTDDLLYKLFMYAILSPMAFYLVKHGLSPKRLKDDPEGLAMAFLQGTAGGIPFWGEIINGFGYALANVSREKRGAKAQWIPGGVGELPFWGGVGDLIRAIQGSGRLSRLSAIGARLGGVPAPRFARVGLRTGLERIGLEKEDWTAKAEKKRLEEGDIRPLFWSEGAMKDVSVTAGMAQRFVSSSSVRDKKKFLDWYYKKLNKDQQKKARAYIQKNRTIGGRPITNDRWDRRLASMIKSVKKAKKK